MAAVRPPPALLTGQLVDERYLVGDLVGQGAMSEVYRAEDERLHRTVALKALRPGSTDHERFAEETTLLCALDHPHLVRLHDAGEHEGVPYLVLNLVDRNLSQALAGGPLGYGAVARIGREIASALAYLHDRGIVHRDVKPSNVLLREDGSACLADLGAALSIDGPRLTAEGLMVGTPMYLAPEQAIGEPVGPPADVYSLGLVLVEASTGEPVFQGSRQEALAARVLRSPEVPPAVPSALRDVVQRMVTVDPALRPTAAEVDAALSSTQLDDTASTASDETTAVMPVLPVAPPPDPERLSGDTEVFEPRPGAAVLAVQSAGERVVGWVRADRDRAIRGLVVAVVLVGLLLGLATRDGFPATSTVSSVPTTTQTTVPTTTTAPPTTVAPAVQQPDGRDEGGGGRDGEEKPKGREGEDD